MLIHERKKPKRPKSHATVPLTKMSTQQGKYGRDWLQIRINLKFEFLFRNAVRCNQGTRYNFTNKRSTG